MAPYFPKMSAQKRRVVNLLAIKDHIVPQILTVNFIAANIKRKVSNEKYPVSMLSAGSLVLSEILEYVLFICLFIHTD